MFLASKKVLPSRPVLSSISSSVLNKVCVVSFAFTLASCDGGEAPKTGDTATSPVNAAANALSLSTTAAIANPVSTTSNGSATQNFSTDIASAVSSIVDPEVSSAPIVLAQASTSVASTTIEVTKQAAEATVASIAAAPALDDAQAQTAALTLWRNNDLSKHPKGSCAGCHGADFFDLARIGSTDLDVVRRAVTDGASQAEAQALLHSIKKMRAKFNMPVTDARNFRPFQPGGQLLPAPATDLPHIANVKRDIAFGKQLESYLPTLMGGRIDSLDNAKKARDELLDIAQGTNIAGANPKKITLRSLPIGLQYPLWSADVHHGKAEGTFNDWVADIAHDPKPEQRAQWQALQDAY